MKLFAVFLFGIWAVAQCQEKYDGFAVYRATPQNDKHMIILQRLEEKNDLQLDFWKSAHNYGDGTDIMVSSENAKYLEEILQKYNIEFYKMIEDVQKLIDGEKKKQNGDTKNLDLNDYNRYETIMTWLDETAASCPDRCGTQVLGPSYEGRDLTGFWTGSDQVNKPDIILECGIHAREWIAPAVCINLINRLVNSYDTDETVKMMVDNFNWYILVLANPDGYEYTHTNERMWRKTRRPNTGSSCLGTDPNRNYGYQWGGAGTSNNPCSSIYRGPNAFSEAETSAIRDFILPRGSRSRAFMAVHSYGQYFLIPWSYGPEYPEDYDDLKAVGDAGAAAITATSGLTYRVGQSTILLGATAGCADDWAKGSAGIDFSYTLELRDTGTYGFILPATQIQPNFEEIFQALAAMATEWKDNYPGPI